MNKGRSVDLLDVFSQTRLIAIRVLLMDQVITSCLVQQRSGSLEFLLSLVFTRLGSDFFDRVTQPGAESPVPDPLFFGSFHPLLTGFVIRQLLSFQYRVNKLAYKYSRQGFFVNQ